MDKSRNNIHVFHTVVLIIKQMNVDVEKYIEASVSEGLKVEVCMETSKSGIECLHESENLSKILNKTNENNVKADVEGARAASEDTANPMDSEKEALGILVITDDDEAAGYLEKLGVAVAGYRAPGHEYESFSAKYVVEELPMVDDEYFNLVYMRAHHIPVEIARTSRTIIREMTEKDLPAMYELYEDPAVAKWTEPLYAYEEELEFTRAYIDNMYTFYGYGLWLVFDRISGELIGRAGISRRVIDDNECCELGYIIKGSRQRQGLGYEVSSEIVKYARDTLGIAELWLCIEKNNTASIALAGKLGFTLYGSSVYDTGNKGAEQCYLYKKEL